MTFRKKHIADIIYNTSPAAAVEKAMELQRPMARKPLGTPLRLSAENFGRVPRVYFEALEDKAIPIEYQRKMLQVMPCEKVVTFAADHVPMASATGSVHQGVARAGIDAMGDGKTSPWQDYLDAGLGFRNHWYPAFFSHELEEADASTGNGEPVGHFRCEVILGERILFRRIDGQVHAIHDQCIHKGVPLSKKPECYTRDTITCWYHGFTYDLKTGALINIVTDPHSALIGRHHIRTYPVRETQGLVFVFIGDREPSGLGRRCAAGLP